MTVSKRITAKVIRGEAKKPQQVSKVLSLLPSDYRGLINLPTVNGVEVSGDLTSKDLSILSSQADNYDGLDLTKGTMKANILCLSAATRQRQRFRLKPLLKLCQY